MLLTRKGQSGQRTPDRFISSLSDSLSRALPTMDRRTFLKRSGIGIGAGIAASQLNLIRKAEAAQDSKAAGGGKIEVRRTVCTHCSVGCAIDAVVENGVWVR
ncbi:MAG: twin-arginine translocation signal domain-containing protein, partial [Noviherbaspirillum sp.]